MQRSTVGIIPRTFKEIPRSDTGRALSPARKRYLRESANKTRA
jgi:hypothetical protein